MSVKFDCLRLATSFFLGPELVGQALPPAVLNRFSKRHACPTNSTTRTVAMEKFNPRKPR